MYCSYICIQEEYSAAHQCFITENSLYVLCWKACDGEGGIQELKDWLLTIKVQKSCIAFHHQVHCLVFMYVPIRKWHPKFIHLQKIHHKYKKLYIIPLFLLAGVCIIVSLFIGQSQISSCSNSWNSH